MFEFVKEVLVDDNVDDCFNDDNNHCFFDINDCTVRINTFHNFAFDLRRYNFGVH